MVRKKPTKFDNRVRVVMEKYIADLMADGFTNEYAKAVLWQLVESYHRRDIRERRKAFHIVPDRPKECPKS
jgi:hypothetical protein